MPETDSPGQSRRKAIKALGQAQKYLVRAQMPEELDALVQLKERIAERIPPQDGRCEPCQWGEHWRCDGHFCTCVNILHERTGPADGI